MNKPLLLVLASFLILSACHSEKENDKNALVTDSLTSSDQNKAPDAAVQDIVRKKPYARTEKIDYQTNKEILEILPLLPDSAMASWEWTKAERLYLLNSVKANNSYVDTTENYNTIVKIKPNYFSAQPVDGLFEVASYKISNGNYIVITNDRTGDGKTINAYELSDGKLTSIKPEALFGRDIDYFISDPENENCKAFYEDLPSLISYKISQLNTIQMQAYHHDEKEAKMCLKGNCATLIFNKNTKKFDLKTVEWLKFKD